MTQNKKSKPKKLKLKPVWCECGKEQWMNLVENGKCSCGVFKHHYHCENCGGIIQIG